MAQVTISSVTLSGWSGPTTGVALYIFANDAFTGSDGTLVQKTVPKNVTSGLGTFFGSYSCSASNGALTIPQVQINSTDDSVDNPGATYSAVLWDQNSNQPIQTFGTLSTFVVPPSPVNTTWSALFTSEAQ